jgi:hypothetical protein
MNPKLAARPAVAALLAILPCYLIERITEYYFLTSSPAFGFWSGDRIDFFIVSVVLVAIAAGLLIDGFWSVAGGYLVGIAILISLFYVFCNPRICYSTGLDGMEPLRLGYFLGCLGIVGVGIGNSLRSHRTLEGLPYVAVAVSIFTSVSFLPIAYTLGGVELLSPLHPWPLLILTFLLSVILAVKCAAATNWHWGLIAPNFSAAIILLLCVGITGQYLASVLPLVLALYSAALLGTLIGLGLSRARRGWTMNHLERSNKPLFALLLVVLLMLVVILPNAVAGVSPKQGASGDFSSYGFGKSVYAGGYMAAGLARTTGVSVDVSFSGSNSNDIQPDNFLAAGLGVHSPGCCVDGIDYGYRFDAYLFHNGSGALAASAWQICDDNAACGGHSWKNLLLLQYARLETPISSGEIHLEILWSGRTVVWTYALGNGPSRTFATMNATSQMNPDFDIGTLPGGYVPGVQSGSYFFQFGILSRYAVGQPGWDVTFTCPAFLADSTWVCVPHANSLQGGQSFWKALWRWGENYGSVSVTPVAQSHSVVFTYSSSSTMPSFQKLW